MPTANPVSSASRLAPAIVAVVVLGGALAVFAMRSPFAEASGVMLASANMSARGEMCSSRNIKGSGVRMEVFASADSSAPSIVDGMVPVLDANMAPGSAAPPVAGQVVRWTGWIKATSTGSRQFILPAGVRGRLTISRIRLLGDGSAVADSGRVDMTENRFYPFTLEVVVDSHATDAGTWLLSWAPPKQGAEPVMRGVLFPPTGVASNTIASPDTTAAPR